MTPTEAIAWARGHPTASTIHEAALVLADEDERLTTPRNTQRGELPDDDQRILAWTGSEWMPMLGADIGEPVTRWLPAPPAPTEEV